MILCKRIYNIITFNSVFKSGNIQNITYFRNSFPKNNPDYMFDLLNTLVGFTRLRNLWVVLAIFSFASASGQSTISLSDSEEPIELPISQLSAYADGNNSTPEKFFDENLQSGNQPRIDFSEPVKSKNSFWVVLDVENANAKDYEGILLAENLDIAYLYVFLENELVDSTKSGRFTPFSQKELNEGTHREIKLPFRIPANSSGKLLVKIQNPTGVPLDLSKWRVQERESWEAISFPKDKKKATVLGIVLGFMGIMFIYNLFIFFFSKDKIYLFYAFYILFPMLYIHAMLGAFNHSFVGENFIYFLYVRVLIPSITMVIYVQFIRLFLETRIKYPKWDKVFRWLIFAEIACFIYMLVVVPTLNDFLTRTIPVLIHAAVQISSLSLLVYLLAKNDGSKIAGYFVVGTSFFFGSALFYISIIILKFASLELGVIAMAIGIAGEIITYSLGLGYRIRTIEKGRRLAQEETAKILENQNKMLEERVLQRTVAIEQQNEEILTQNEELQQQHEEIVTQRDYIAKQNEEVSQKNQQITDSIRYAQTIQEAILPFDYRLKEGFPNGYFTVYRPKDIVSGDIYWYEKVGNLKFLAVVDCTGHGVPGAFMSMIASSILNDEVVKNGMRSPAEILEGMHKTLKNILNQDEKGSNQDGMDVAFCSIEEVGEQSKITFAGAKRPLYYLAVGKEELGEIKGSRRSIGGFQGNETPFVNHEILLPKNSTIYLSSDGMADQHNPRGRKIGSLKIKDFVPTLGGLSMIEQKDAMDNFLNSHQAKQFQRDDITFVGVKV